MIRRILISLDGSPSSYSALSIAGSVAGIVDAELLGLFVEDELRFLDSSLTMRMAQAAAAQPLVKRPLPPERLLEVEEEVEAERKDLEQRFRSVCEEAGLRGRLLVQRGVPADLIAESARTSDLAVLGSSGLHRGRNDPHPGSTAEALLRRTSRPVLIVPEEPVGDWAMVVAFDGSIASERALRAAAEFADISSMQRVHLLSVGFGEEETERIQRSAIAYLEAYGLEVNAARAEGHPGEVIRKFSEEVQASVIVAGAFGSNRLRELVFGSTSLELLNNPQAATLLVS